MRRSKAKEKILETAMIMLGEVGYGSINVNTLALEAGVSIGTLYYHFPEGKLSILIETRKMISTRYENSFRERLGEAFIDNVESFDDGISHLLDVLIDIHRKERLALAAMESEVLGNLAVYDEVAGTIDVGDLIKEDAEPVVNILSELLVRFPVMELSLRDAIKVSKVLDVLIHRFVYVESIFGTENEFKEILNKIIYSLLRS